MAIYGQKFEAILATLYVAIYGQKIKKPLIKQLEPQTPKNWPEAKELKMLIYCNQIIVHCICNLFT